MRDFDYIHTDIPAGMTCAEYRRTLPRRPDPVRDAIHRSVEAYARGMRTIAAFWDGESRRLLRLERSCANAAMPITRTGGSQ